MTTWKAGRRILRKKLAATSLPLADFLSDPQMGTVTRVPGTAIYLSGNPDGTPIALLHNLKHNKVLHERVVLLTVETADVPRVDRLNRVRVNALGNGFYQIIGQYGFMEDPVVLEILGRSKDQGLEFSIQETTFFLSRQNVVPARRHGLARWRTKPFAFLLRNSEGPSDFFRLPCNTCNQVVELGMHVEI